MGNYAKSGDFVIRCSSCASILAITPHTPSTFDFLCLECNLTFELDGDKQ